MKKAVCFCAVMLLILNLAACGCSTETASRTPAVHDDPAGEYAALANTGDTQSISALVQDLAAVGDYVNAASIVSAEAVKSRFLTDFPSLYAMFAGHEDALNPDVWTAYYLAYSKGHTSEWEEELALLPAYHAVVRRYYEDDWQAFRYVLENADRQFTDANGTQLAQCGTAPNGKVLIYFSHGKNGAWMLGASAALPAEYIPQSLKEVEYVILIEETLTPVGTYTNGGTAKRRDYTVSLIHCPGGEVLGKSYPVEGEDPPRAINENQPGGTGDPPEAGKLATELELALSWISRSQPY